MNGFRTQHYRITNWFPYNQMIYKYLLYLNSTKIIKIRFLFTVYVTMSAL